MTHRSRARDNPSVEAVSSDVLRACGRCGDLNAHAAMFCGCGAGLLLGDAMEQAIRARAKERRREKSARRRRVAVAMKDQAARP